MYRTALGLALASAVTLAACNTDSVMRPEVDVGAQTYATPVMRAPSMPRTVSQPLPDIGTQDEVQQAYMPPEPAYIRPAQEEAAPAEPAYVEPQVSEPAPPKRRNIIAAGFSRMINPLSRSEESDGMPAEEVQCRKSLDRMGVTYRELPTITGQGDCGIAHPVEVSMLGGGVKMQPAATLTCEMAETVARWSKKELVPAARVRYWSGIDTIHQASSYSCRWIKGRTGGTLSEHGKGRALDIAQITLNNGRNIIVKKKAFWKFREKGLLNSVRSDGCDYFSTVLGPGYDADHKDHFHFDIKERRSGHRSCR
jgi:hypothetical protein